jgi:predicted nucleic acid-binding protein
VDAGVLIAAAKGKDDMALRAMHILDDPDREFASSAFIRLEVSPKAIHNKRVWEAEFYRDYFDHVSCWADDFAALLEQAYEKAASYGLSAMDSIHVASAISTSSEELVTTEKPGKPIHRVTEIRVVFL